MPQLSLRNRIGVIRINLGDPPIDDELPTTDGKLDSVPDRDTRPSLKGLLTCLREASNEGSLLFVCQRCVFCVGNFDRQLVAAHSENSGE